MQTPETITARVVTPGDRPRVLGYDVQGDLARYYRFPELVLLAATGQLPSEPLGRAFDVALQFLAPVSVAEAPVHAAVLTRLCGASGSSVISAAVVGLAEQARHFMNGKAGLIAWLEGRTQDMPPACRSADEADAEAVGRLREALASTGLMVRGLDAPLGLGPALLAVLHACGLTSAEQIELAIVLARMPCAVAEALTQQPGRYEEYPMDLPPFHHAVPHGR